MNRYHPFDNYKKVQGSNKVVKYRSISATIDLYGVVKNRTIAYLKGQVIRIKNIIEWRKQLKQGGFVLLVQSCLLVAMDILNFSIVGGLLFFSAKMI
jgi:hypothetical protein